MRVADEMDDVRNALDDLEDMLLGFKDKIEELEEEVESGESLNEELAKQCHDMTKCLREVYFTIKDLNIALSPTGDPIEELVELTIEEADELQHKIETILKEYGEL